MLSIPEKQTIKTFLTSILSWEVLAQIDPTENGGEDIRQNEKKSLEDKLQSQFPNEMLSESILPDGTIIISFGGVKLERNIYDHNNEVKEIA